MEVAATGKPSGPTPAPAGAPVVAVEEITKRYAGVQAIGSATLDVRAGEVLGLVGENGAGKSTLIEILAGAVRRDSGTIRVDGEEVEIANERDSEELGIHVIHQNLALVDRLSVAENLLLGTDLGSRGGIVSRRHQEAVAKPMLEGFVEVDPGARVSKLSIAQRWMVAIAKACSGSPRLVIMDEPTAALADTEVRAVFSVVKSMCARGIAVVFVSHRLEEVLYLCDRVAVMKDGISQGTFPAAELDHDRLVELIVGDKGAKSLESLEREVPPEPGDTVLAVKGLSGGPLRDVSFSVGAGEILGIGGLVGSGRSSLLAQVFGVHQPDTATIELDGEPISVGHPADAIKRGIALIPEDRRDQALLLLRSIRENMVLSHMRLFRRGPRLPIPSRPREKRATREKIDRLSVRTTGTEQRIAHLSGGNQQKVVIARSLMADDLRLLMLDEPTKGVDVGARLEIFTVIRELAQRGLAVVIVSSDLEELVAISHRVVVLREGRVAGELKAPVTTADVLAHAFASGER